MNEHIKKDKIIQYLGGRLRIKDCIFEYKNQAKGIEIQGDLNPDLKDDYFQIDSEVFSITVGKSLIYNVEVNKNYVYHRLIQIIH